MVATTPAASTWILLWLSKHDTLEYVHGNCDATPPSNTVYSIEVSTLLELSVVWVACAAVIPAAAPRIMPAAGYTARWH